jgi:hypothetical protein
MYLLNAGDASENTISLNTLPSSISTMTTKTNATATTASYTDEAKNKMPCENTSNTVSK